VGEAYLNDPDTQAAITAEVKKACGKVAGKEAPTVRDAAQGNREKESPRVLAVYYSARSTPLSPTPFYLSPSLSLPGHTGRVSCLSCGVVRLLD
jgi:hypothetical protein